MCMNHFISNMMIDITEFCCLILVCVTLTVVPGHSDVRKQKTSGPFYLTKFSMDLDGILYAVET